MKKWYIRLDTQKQKDNELITMVKQDIYSNELYINLVNNGKPIDLTDAVTIGIAIDKADATEVIGSCRVADIKKGLVVYTVDYQSIAALGLNTFTIKIVYAESVITTTSFIVKVIDDPFAGTDGSIVSTSSYPILTGMMQENTAIKNAELIRVTSEIDRLESESNRVATELIRGNNETDRLAAEVIRSSNEDLRKSTELLRVNADSIREVSEQARKDAESSRNTNEGLRHSQEISRQNEEDQRELAELSRKNEEFYRDQAESVRFSKEGTRQLQETGRVNKESVRETNESTRQTQEGTRQTNEIVRVNAESSRATTEQARATAEGGRVAAESSRVSNESGRATTEQARVNAEAARVLAETGRMDLINSKASQAEVTSFKEDYTNQRAEDKLEVSTLKNDYATFNAKITPQITLENLLPYNNFTIAAYHYPVKCVFAIANNVGTFTANASAGGIGAMLTYNATDKYYIQAIVKTDSSNVGLNLPGKTVTYHSGSGEYEILSNIYTGLASGTMRIFDYRTSGWTPVDVKKLVAINLTATFGVGNEPTVEYMNLLLSQLPDSWFTGVITMPNNSINKNKFFANVNGEVKMIALKDFATSEDLPLGEIEGIQSATIKGAIEEVNKDRLSNKKIVCFGDSVTEFGNYPLTMGIKAGAEVISVGVGGTCMVKHVYPSYDAFSMTKLADAVASGDYSLQIANQITAVDDNNTAIVNRLIAIDWNTVDIITIAHGTNDFYGGYTLGTEDSIAGDTSFYGGLNYIVDKILTAYPHLLIAIITPTWRWVGGADCDTTPNSKGNYLVDYINAIKQVGQKYHLPVLDMFNNSGFNKYTASAYINPSGDVHPSVAGYILFGEKVGAFLLSNF